MKKKQGHYTVEANNLIYHPSGKGASVKVKGEWALDRKHNLVCLVSRSQNDTFGESISFQTKIESVKHNRIVFTVLDRMTPSRKKIKRIYLTGTWGMNKYNRLTFRVKKDKKTRDLVFKNQWQITDDNRLIYTWRRDAGRREQTHSFSLNGRWLFAAQALVYKIEGVPRNSLRITLEKQKVVCDPKKSRLNFICGFGYEMKKGVRVRKKQFSLSGTWQIYSKTKVGFVLKYDRGGSVTWVFPVEVAAGRNRIELKIITRRGKKIESKLSFLRNLADNKELFVDFSKNSAGLDIKAGLRIFF